MKDEPDHEIPADSMLEQEYEDRNGCSVDNDETVDPENLEIDLGGFPEDDYPDDSPDPIDSCDCGG